MRTKLSVKELLELAPVQRERPYPSAGVSPVTKRLLAFACAVVLIASLGALAWLYRVRPYVPDVKGLSLDQARRVATDAGLDIVVSATLYSTEPADTVIGQTPETGSRPIFRRTLRVVLSSGKQTINIPDLIGETELRARSILEQMGLNAQVVYEYAPDAIGKVIATTPAADSAIETGDIVVLRIGAPRSQVALIEYDLHSNTIVIDVSHDRSGQTIANDIALRLSSLLQAAQATVEIMHTGDIAEGQALASANADGDGASLVIRLHTGPHDVETVVVHSDAPSREYLPPNALAVNVFDLLREIPVSTSLAFDDDPDQTDYARRATIAFGTEGDPTLYKDTRWKDNIARSIYLAIGKTLVP